MKKIKTRLSVSETAAKISQSLDDKGFTLFCDIDHQANAKGVDLDLPASRTLFLGIQWQEQNSCSKI